MQLFNISGQWQRKTVMRIWLSSPKCSSDSDYCCFTSHKIIILRESLPQLQPRQGLPAPLDPSGSNFQSKEMCHNTTSTGTQIPKENCNKKDNHHKGEMGMGGDTVVWRILTKTIQSHSQSMEGVCHKSLEILRISNKRIFSLFSICRICHLPYHQQFCTMSLSSLDKQLIVQTSVWCKK